MPTNPDRPSDAISPVPLCVDLDGTLVRSDTLWETLLQLLRRRPLKVAGLVPAYFRGGRSAFKSAAVDCMIIDPAPLPYHADILAEIREARAAGRPVHLVTGANQRLAHAVADHVGLFDDVIGSEPGRNNTGHDKADELARRFGLRGFDYAGNSQADRKVWAKSNAAYVVGSQKLKEQAEALAPVAFHVPAGTIGRPRAIFDALRPERLVADALVCVPGLLSGRIFESGAALNVVLAFVVFGAFSAAFRVLGELLHLPEARKTGRMSRRSFAAGELPLSWGVGMAAGLLAVACLLTPALPPGCIWASVMFAAVEFVRAMRFEMSRAGDIVLSALSLALRLAAGFALAG
jgi:hypothetical protein